MKVHFSYKIDGADDPLNRLQLKRYDTSGPLAADLTIHPSSNVTYEYMTTGDKSRIKKIETAAVLTEEFTYESEEGSGLRFFDDSHRLRFL